MPRSYATPTQDAILDALSHCETMTRKELEVHLGVTMNVLSSALFTMRRYKVKKVYIAYYTRQDGTAGRCIPHYAIGDKPDAVEPKQLTSKQRNAKYRERHQARINARNMARRGRVYNIWQGLM